MVATEPERGGAGCEAAPNLPAPSPPAQAEEEQEGRIGSQVGSMRRARCKQVVAAEAGQWGGDTRSEPAISTPSPPSNVTDKWALQSNSLCSQTHEKVMFKWP